MEFFLKYTINLLILLEWFSLIYSIFCIKSFHLNYLDLRGVFTPSLMIADPATADLAVTPNNRSIEYFFASDARYIYIYCH